MTTLTAYQWRARIGPKWRPATHPASFDWTAYQAGIAGTYAADKVLGSTATAPAVEVFLSNTTNLPTKGGLWIGAANGPWSYVEYTGKGTGKVTGVTWETPTGELAQSHGAGSTARQWWLLDGKASAELSVERQANATLSSATWTVTMSGYYFPMPALRRGHLIVIESRPHQSGSYTVLIVGWILSVKASQSKRRQGEWTITVGSIADMLGTRMIEAQRVGDLNIGPQCNASGAQALGRAYKEVYSFDFRQAAPNFDPARATDGDQTTLWIGEQMIGTNRWNTSNNDPLRTDGIGPLIKTVYLRRPAGYDSVGYRFIELQAQDTMQDTWLCFHEPGMNQFLDIGEIDYDPGQRCIIVENEELYLKENPINTSRAIVEIPDKTWWDNINPAGYMMGLLRANDPVWSHMVAWGNIVSQGYTHVQGPASLWSDPDYPGHLYWQGATVAAPDPGDYLTYEPARSASILPVNYWRVDERGAPGYEIAEWAQGSDETPNQGQLVPPYLIVELPTVDLFLKDDIDDTLSPGVGQTLEIVGADGNNTTAGLEPSGTIQIGTEQITYSALDGKRGVIVSARLVGGAGTAVHEAGDQILVVESDGVATAALPIKKIGWTRPPEFLPAAHAVPKNFEVYYTRRVDAREPFEPDWLSDWLGPVSVANNGLREWSHTFPDTERVLKFCLVIYEMSINPARPRLNEFHVYLDESLYLGTVIASPATTADVMTNILLAAGAPAGAITIGAGLPQLKAANTAKSDGWSVASSFADFVGARILISLDSRITVELNETILTNNPGVDRSWDAETAKGLDVTWSAPPSIGQIRLKWYDSEGNLYSAEYPDEPEDGADPQDVGPLVLSGMSAATQAAQRIYIRQRYPTTVNIEVPAGNVAIAPLEWHRVDWSMDAGHANLDRYYIVTGASHKMRPGRTWTTTLQLQQTEIESEA